MIQLESLQQTSMAGGDDGFVVHSPVTCERSLVAFQAAIGDDGHLSVDGIVYRVRGWEVENVEEPVEIGEKIGILVEDADGIEADIS